MPVNKAIINTDGVAVPNPGKTGIGVVIKDEQGELIASISRAIGDGTNNQAEYTAIITALEKAHSLGIKQVELRSDSELVVNQINGKYRVKNTALRPLYLKVMELAQRFDKITVKHVSRRFNKEADKLAGDSLK